MATEASVFETLHSVDVSEKVKTKNGLKYLSWSSAWAEVKKRFPNATFKVYPQVIDDGGHKRFWHDDGKSGWVEVGVTIDGIEQIEVLAIMDFKNQAIPVEKITSVEANKAKQRCLVKTCAMHGLSLHIYEGEDTPESTARAEELKDLIKEVVKKRCSISDKASEKVAELCKKAEKEANPNLDEELISGNYKNIDDVDILENLYNNLLAVRK